MSIAFLLERKNPNQSNKPIKVEIYSQNTNLCSKPIKESNLVGKINNESL